MPLSHGCGQLNPAHVSSRLLPRHSPVHGWHGRRTANVQLSGQAATVDQLPAAGAVSAPADAHTATGAAPADADPSGVERAGRFLALKAWSSARGARCSGPVQRPDALGGERGEGYSRGPREITVASGYRPASRGQAQGRPAQLGGGSSCHFGKGAYASAGDWFASR
jgi:hypothetical protein